MAGLRRAFAYRLAALAGVLANVTFGYIRGAVLLAIAGAAGATAAGYDATSLATYNWLTQSSIGALAIWGTSEVSDRVRTGDIAVDLARPVDVLGSFLAQDLGRAAASTLLRGAPTLLVGALTVGLVVPYSPGRLALGVVAAVIGVVISFLARFALQLIAFWTVEIRGFQTLYMVLSGFCAGLVFPLPLMPPWLQAIAHATPFPSMLQTPVDILSGRVTGADALTAVGIQLAWTAALLVLCRVTLAAGTRRLVIQGG